MESLKFGSDAHSILGLTAWAHCHQNVACTKVKVPLDAYLMDFVFSERKDGGIFDNKNGMDYHVPVSGGVNKEPPCILCILQLKWHPLLRKSFQLPAVSFCCVLMAWEVTSLNSVMHLICTIGVGGLCCVVTSFSLAVQDLNHSVDIILPKYECMNSVHDIIHCHDWSSAPVAWLFKELYMHYGRSKARVVFTIHNLEFGAQLIGKAMAYSNKVSANPAVAAHLYKFHGILNGIHPDIWDPYNDEFIPVVLLGSAPDPRVQNNFVNLANQLHSSHNDRARLCLTYDEPLSHLIYASADFILVPSVSEPCGLTQLTAMRYDAAGVDYTVDSTGSDKAAYFFHLL
ncbi:hypothetical protein ACH5RR_014828 [Cinchona calisaya]|uniref:starch synthase n=1 Tax=Cinchona calisaya TaxID=153742 RepID=A0ABD2ZRD7_9GENT